MIQECEFLEHILRALTGGDLHRNRVAAVEIDPPHVSPLAKMEPQELAGRLILFDIPPDEPLVAVSGDKPYISPGIRTVQRVDCLKQMFTGQHGKAPRRTDISSPLSSRSSRWRRNAKENPDHKDLRFLVSCSSLSV
jgi:hypothetical protein